MNKNIEEYKKKANRIRYVIISTAIAIFILGILISVVYYVMNKKQPIDEVQMSSNGDETETFTNELGEVLLNPGKGFILRVDSDVKYDNIVNIGYTRFYWKDIEPEEGKYNWKDIDRRIEEYAKKGKKYAFGVSCASSSVNDQYVTPKWVFDAGAQYYYATISDELTQIIPVWTDEIFLEKLNNFIEKLAERYDGNENIAFIDIRSYGNWGEQHLGKIGGTDITSSELKTLFIEPYYKLFKKTMLVNPWGKDIYNDTYQWAIDNGISIRRDGIMKLENGKECFDYAYGKLPTIFEYISEFKQMKANSLWSEEKLIKYIEEWKPSYTEFYPEMYKDNPSFCKYIANKIGYYFKFKEAHYTNNIKTTENNNISLTFKNEGVAPLYEPCTVYIGVLDQKYNLVKKYKTDIDPHTWMPGEDIKEEINLRLKGVETGNYIIALGLFYKENDEKPTYLLGNTGKTDDKWYVFGRIDITYPEEEYVLKDEHVEKAIKEAEQYKLSVKIDNLREKDEYKIKLYTNNNLKQTINVDNTKEHYEKDITFKFDNITDEKNMYKLQIEKNGNVVSELTGEVLVTDFVQNYIARNPVDIVYSTTNLTNQSVIATLKTNAEITVTNNQNNKLHTFDDNGEFTFEYTIKGRQFTKKATVTNIDKIVPSITGVENDGFYQESVIPVITDNNLKNIRLYKNNNISGYLKNMAITEDGTYKIIAEDKAGNITEVNFDICKIPSTVSYSETGITNKDVVATLNSNYDLNITNNNGSSEYKFTENGTFTFNYTVKGKSFAVVAEVNNIDKKAPEIKAVENGKLYIDEAVKPYVVDDNLSEVGLYLNSVQVKDYKSGSKLTEEGFYKLVAKDLAGNETVVHFNIIINNSKDYIVQDKNILNISYNTNTEDFMKKFSNSSGYHIERKGQALGEKDIIATGDKLKTKSGDEYTLIVTGDMNKDGDVNISDIVKLRRYLLLKDGIDEEERLAADCNLDGSPINISDLIKMRLIVLMKGANN